MQVSIQTLKDLEFPTVQEQICAFVLNEKTKENIRDLKPYKDRECLIRDLNATSEYLSSFENENNIPFSEFYYLDESLKRLEIENYYLAAEDFFKIKSNTLQIKEIGKYLENFQVYYPTLQSISSKIIFEKEIVKEIDAVFNKFGEIKDDASSELKFARTRLRELNSKITELFNKSLTHYSDLLDDIRESVIDNKRVLAVKSAVRRRVKGQLLGTSKTGSISFIEPESVFLLRREYDEIKEDEKKIIIKILIQLSATIAIYKPLLEEYQDFLEYIDFTQSKARYAELTHSILPNISKNEEISLIDAYHPLLYLNNLNKKEKTIPQTLSINNVSRIIIISGPNAGGKSITLKTVGLLQLMIQSGILVPVHPKSSIGFFEKIFTDIGDNQSIENHLSTYSYRLKQMAFFLKEANEKSLLLVDEFGTGSDPDLGGALAEVFFEEFYEKQAYGIFTTHYTNIKLSAEKLENALNACMLFDNKSLEPLYKLEIGQAGSSFTFEVAEKNKIPFRLINRAKKKIENDKVRLDKTILKLQQEKFDIQKTKNEILEIKDSSEIQAKELENTQERVQQKLYDFQQLYDSEQKNLMLGKRIQDLANSYSKTKNKKILVSQFLKLVEMENAKKNTENKETDKKGKLIQKEVDKKLKENRKEIQEQKEVIEQQKEAIITKQIESIEVGDRVKIKDSNSVGIVEKIKNKTIFINYGQFTTQTSIYNVNKV